LNRRDTEEEWRRWIEDGEKRNSDIPSSPNVFYGKRREWKAGWWDHFLVGAEENNDGETTAFQWVIIEIINLFHFLFVSGI